MRHGVWGMGYGVATYGCFEVWGMGYLQLEQYLQLGQYLRLGLCMRLGLICNRTVPKQSSSKRSDLKGACAEPTSP